MDVLAMNDGFHIYPETIRDSKNKYNYLLLFRRARRDEQTNPGSGWSGLSRLADQTVVDSPGDGFGNSHGFVLALESAFATV